MKRVVLVLGVLMICLQGWSQNLELLDKQENFQASFSETVRLPLRIKNYSDKPQIFVIRRISADLGTTQKGYFCLDRTCQDASTEEYIKRLEPGETLQNLVYTIESGMQNAQNTIRFQIFNKNYTQESVEHSFYLSVSEKSGKSVLYRSKEITIQDVYPNPVQDQAFIDYQLHNETVKAKLVIHNILGKAMNELELSAFETRAKLVTDDFTSGIYFYTLYLDNTGVLTRKLIVRK